MTQIKTDLFKGVFDGGIDTVELSNKKQTEPAQQASGMMGEEQLAPVGEHVSSEDLPEDIHIT